MLFQCFWQKRHSASSASRITETWGKQNCCLLEIQNRGNRMIWSIGD